jgi:hypothetical protein
MNASAAPPAPGFWARSRFWLGVSLMFAGQIGFILWLGKPLPKPPLRSVSSAPSFSVTKTPAGEFPGLEDPTLFALPHLEGFSGGAWLQIPRQEFKPEKWTEPFRYLAIADDQLGAAFENFVRTNPAPAFPAVTAFEPKLTMPQLGDDPIVVPPGYRLEGPLARRRLLTRFDLPPQAGSDLLTNSVLQLAVDEQGNTLSAHFISRSGKPETDNLALALAKSARFAPVETPAGPGHIPPLTLGKLIFQWQTVPVPATNSVAKE